MPDRMSDTIVIRVDDRGEVKSAQLDRIETMLKRLTNRHRRPIDKDGNSTEACGNCISWEKNQLDFSPDPLGRCFAGFPCNTTLQMGQQQKVKGDDGVERMVVKPVFIGATTYPAEMRQSQWCEHWWPDENPKEDLLGKLAQDVRKKAGENGQAALAETPEPSKETT